MSGSGPLLEISRLSKRGGPLTKELSLTDDGKLRSDGSACVMSGGLARRAVYQSLSEFAEEISNLDSSQAIALGALREDLPDCVRVTTKDEITLLNGEVPSDLIARTGEYIAYRSGEPALALIDVDTKGMPKSVKKQIDTAGGYWEALVSVMPNLAITARVVRRSTSTGIVRDDTGEALPGSDGTHFFVMVADGGDIERFLRTLHQRCWLRGFGWMMVGAGGQLLERSLVDRMVYAPERLVFEGAPVLKPPLSQNRTDRAATVHDGTAIDTTQTCPPLTIMEQSALRVLRAKEAVRLRPDSERTRKAFVHDQAVRLITRNGLQPEEAERIATQQTSGVLLPDVALPFDSAALDGTLVRDVLADPKRFEGETLADPLEGVEYGICKAKIMLWPDGTPWIHSFAHGRTVYHLRHDAKNIAAILAAAPDDNLPSLFARLMANATVEPSEAEALRDSVATRSGTGKRALDRQARQLREERDAARAREERDRRAAERLDRRPQITAPDADAPWLPQMGVLNDALSASTALEPPMRDIDGAMAQIRVRAVPNMHALSSGATNSDDEAHLPPPEQPLLTRLSEVQLAELIERHIDYTDMTGRSVHLAAPFVRHFQIRNDDRLPTVAAIATLPIVLMDGTLLARNGLDRNRGIAFRIQREILPLIPTQVSTSSSDVAYAMRFLTDEWLADVATDYHGKCALISAALTIIERALLPDRPAFFVTAGRRGGGKTTTLVMLIVAVTGVRPSAAAWSTNEEERRKALLAYLSEAVPAIIWDNITRGSQISCPHIEKACTAAFYSDRKLGVSELVSVAASSIHLFTGNNIAPRGDLASRSLQVRLEIDRPDPENRDFTHQDPIGWTEANRGRILSALYTILLGNPALRPESDAVPQTRFKTWWRLVGSAVENAAREHANHASASVIDTLPHCPPSALNFRNLFLKQEDDEEESESLTHALVALNAAWPGERFQATDLARYLNDRSEYRTGDQIERSITIREFLFPTVPTNHDVSTKAVGKALKRHLDEPVRSEDKTLILKASRDKKDGPKGPLFYAVEAK